MEQINNNDTPSGESAEAAHGTATLASNIASSAVGTQEPSGKVDVASAENEVALRPSAENYLSLSLAYWQAGRFQDCIAMSRKALNLRPKYAEAHNNISAAYHSMGQWDAAIAAARDALRISPNYRLAKNNLAQSLASKKEQEDKLTF